MYTNHSVVSYRVYCIVLYSYSDIIVAGIALAIDSRFHVQTKMNTTKYTPHQHPVRRFYFSFGCYCFTVIPVIIIVIRLMCTERSCFIDTKPLYFIHIRALLLSTYPPLSINSCQIVLAQQREISQQNSQFHWMEYEENTHSIEWSWVE